MTRVVMRPCQQAEEWVMHRVQAYARCNKHIYTYFIWFTREKQACDSM
jgi:hypothetical protein